MDRGFLGIILTKKNGRFFSITFHRPTLCINPPMTKASAIFVVKRILTLLWYMYDVNSHNFISWVDPAPVHPRCTKVYCLREGCCISSFFLSRNIKIQLVADYGVYLTKEELSRLPGMEGVVANVRSSSPMEED